MAADTMIEAIHYLIHAVGLLYSLYLHSSLVKVKVNIKVNHQPLNFKIHMKNILLRIWNTPPIHSIAMVVLGAIVGAIEPFANSWLNAQPVPSLHAILVTALKAAIAAFIGYTAKNGIFGSSGTSASSSANPQNQK